MKKQTKIILSLTIGVIIIIVVFILTKSNSEKDSTTSKSTDKNLIVGDWIRTDADYMMKINKIKDDGTLEAQYFNPKLINVSKANWEQSYGNLKINIELRDVNYPGSTYSLHYLPDRDMLAGEYYQAVEGLTFYVEFARSKQN